MKHAFLIIAHNEFPILKVLLSMLDDERNDIYLHIDRKSKDLSDQVAKIRLNKAKLFIIDPISVYWGDISQVIVEMNLFEHAFKNGPYMYYHLLSGVDLPIKTQDYIHNFFEKNKGKEFVDYWFSNQHIKNLRKRTSKYFIFTQKVKNRNLIIHTYASFCRNIFLLIQKAIFYNRTHKFELCKGSNWVSITNDLCEIIIDNKKKILKALKYTLAPDEIFIQTILWNSRLKPNIYGLTEDEPSIRAIDWERGGPYIWQNSDTDELIASASLFARKFSSQNMDIVETIQDRFSKK